MKSNRTVARDLRRQEFKLLIAKEEEKIKKMKETNRLLVMFYEVFLTIQLEFVIYVFVEIFLDR